MNNISRALIIKNMDHKSRLISYEQVWMISSSVQNITSTLLKGPSYIPTKGDRIWFYPGCDIPRFKVKQFCLKNDVAVVKYAEKATIKFIGPDTINELITRDVLNIVSKTELLKWFDTIMCNAYTELRTLIVNNPEEEIYLDNAYHEFTNTDLFGINVLDTDHVEVYNSVSYIVDERYQKLLNIQNDPQIRFQDDLLSLLNTGIVLDEQMYNDIHRLFESTDKENTKVAMEAMANCDFQKSAVYLLLLMKGYGQKISDSGNKHHVNFKSLIKYFQVKNLENMTIDNMIDSLRGQKLLSVDNLNKLMPLAMERIREKGDMKNIKIKDVELSEEAELSIAENILDQQIPTPSVPVLETPEHNTLFADVKGPF